MSGSSGLNLTPDAMLKLYEPEVILWLYSKTEPTKAFDFCFDDGILRQYFEFDRMLEEYRSGKASEYTVSVMDNCLIPGRTVQTVPMSLLVQLGSIVDFNPAMLETVFAKIGTPYTREQFADRLARARYWLEQCAPEQVNRLRTTRNFEVYDTLSDEEKAEIARLHDYLAAGGYTLDELNTALYAIPKQVFGEDKSEKELKTLQGSFFRTVYACSSTASADRACTCSCMPLIPPGTWDCWISPRRAPRRRQPPTVPLPSRRQPPPSRRRPRRCSVIPIRSSRFRPSRCRLMSSTGWICACAGFSSARKSASRTTATSSRWRTVSASA